MDRELTNCVHDPSSSVSDGGTGGGPGGTAGISGFRILNVQNLHVGGDETDQEPGTVFSCTGNNFEYASIYDVRTDVDKFETSTHVGGRITREHVQLKS